MFLVLAWLFSLLYMPLLINTFPNKLAPKVSKTLQQIYSVSIVLLIFFINKLESSIDLTISIMHFFFFSFDFTNVVVRPELAVPKPRPFL